MRIFIFALLLVSSLVRAEGADPTRPPTAWLNAPEALPATEVGGLRLQSVLLPQRGRPVAVISGNTVALGERVGEATLVKLTERLAVLRGPDGVTHLYLTPDVEKQLIVTPGSRNKGKTGHMKDVP